MERLQRGGGVNVFFDFTFFSVYVSHYFSTTSASLSVFHFDTDAIVCVFFLLEGCFCYSSQNAVGLIKASSFIRGKSAPKGMWHLPSMHLLKPAAGNSSLRTKSRGAGVLETCYSLLHNTSSFIEEINRRTLPLQFCLSIRAAHLTLPEPGSFWQPDSHIKRRKRGESSSEGFRSALLPNKGLCCDSQRNSCPRSLKLAFKVTLWVQKAQYSHGWCCIHVFTHTEHIIVKGTFYRSVNKVFSVSVLQLDCTWPTFKWWCTETTFGGGQG